MWQSVGDCVEACINSIFLGSFHFLSNDSPLIREIGGTRSGQARPSAILKAAVNDD